MRRVALALAALFASTMSTQARANGHGPVYGLSTPTLGQGAWSIDVAGMYRLDGNLGDPNAQAAMIRPMVSYGITEDLQLSLSVPVPVYSRVGQRPSSRMMAMMPGVPDAEALVAWRFARVEPAVGSRLESTALVGGDYPTDAERGGVPTSPGIVAGAVTGYASRSVYAWAGAMYRRYMSPTGPGADHVGDQVLYSLVLGWRPPALRRDDPTPDWRIFVEGVGELTLPDVLGGADVVNTGGHQVFVGPTLLGLYGAWGISGGPEFAVYSRMNGSQAADRVRMVIDYTYWWF